MKQKFRAITALSSFVIPFLILLVVIGTAGKLILQLKNIEYQSVKTASEWEDLYHVTGELFTFTQKFPMYGREPTVREMELDIQHREEEWFTEINEFEASLVKLRDSSLRYLVGDVVVKKLENAWNVWALTKIKLEKNRALFEEIMASPLGKELLRVSYPRLVEAYMTGSGRSGKFSRENLWIFYRLQDSLTDLDVSEDVFTRLVAHIASDVSLRVRGMIILIAAVSLLISFFIVGIAFVVFSRAERDLRENEEKYRTLVENIPQKIFLKDRDSVYISCNENYARDLNIRGTEITGKNDYDFHPRELAEKYRADDKEIIVSGKTRSFEEGYIQAGVEVLVQTVKTPVRDVQGRIIGVLGIFWDITERKRAEEKIKHLNAVLRSVRDVNQLITKEKDPTDLMRQSCEILVGARGFYHAWIALIDKDRKVTTATGSSLGDRFGAFIVELERKGLPVCGVEALSSPDVVVIKDPLSDCNGCYMPEKFRNGSTMTARLECEGEIYGVLSAAIPREYVLDEGERSLFKELADDIAFALHAIEVEHNRRKAEDSLRKSEESYRRLINNLGAGVVEHAPDTAILISNIKAHVILGLTEDQMRGKTAMDPAWKFLREDNTSMPLGEYPVNRVIATHTGLHGYVVGIRRPKEEDVAWVLVDAFPVFNGKGDLSSVVVTFIEITERKKAEEELHRLKENLETEVLKKSKELLDAKDELNRREKLAAMGQAAGAMAHEFRNQLGIVKNSAYYVKSQLKTEKEDIKRHLELIEKEVAATDRVIDDVLFFARAKKTVVSNDNIREILRESIDKLPLPGGVELECVLEDDIPDIMADHRQLVHAVYNIMLNAVQGMEGSGKLLVATRKTDDSVEISIKDDGPGIDKNDLEKIFVPFFTTKFRGTGLGLPTAQTLVANHGGSIDVESEPGKGTVVTIILPA